MTPDFLFTDLFRADVRTSRAADELNSKLQAALGFDYRYQVARLAVAASLGERATPKPPKDMTGKPIRGETLFGQDEADLAFWIASIVQHGSEPASRKAILDQAAAHWHRGVMTLHRLWTRFEGDPGDFLMSLADSARSPVAAVRETG